MGYLKPCSVFLLLVFFVACVSGEDPYRFYTWNVTYGDIYPFGIQQQVLYSQSYSYHYYNCCCLSFLFLFLFFFFVIYE